METKSYYRQELEAWALEHASGVGQDMDEVKEMLAEMNTHQLEHTMEKMGYDIADIIQEAVHSLVAPQAA